MTQAAAADRGEEVLHGLHVLICAHRNFLHLGRTGSGRVPAGGTSCSSVELDQVLKDQPTPSVPARLHKQPAFPKPAKFDRRETEIFRKRSNLLCSSVIVARKEHDSPATMYGRILGKDGSDQMVEALNQSSASEGRVAGLGTRA